MAELDLVVVDKARFSDAIEMYFLWKELDSRIRTSATRGVNFPETISEALCCYAMDFKWNKGSGGDAIDDRNDNRRIIEMKATSNWNSDTTSFSPTEHFDDLFFLRLNKRDDQLFIYDTGVNSNTLKDIKVNNTQTVREQQEAGRRPRFSVINLIIKAENIKPLVMVDIRTKKVNKL